jgi:nitrogen fixation/metabolism regulation signal transduction histidine kinase
MNEPRRIALAIAASAILVVGAGQGAAAVGLAPRWAAAVAALVGLGGAPLFASWAFSPIGRRLRAVEDGLRGCGEQDYTIRLRPESGGAVSRLVDAYNGMADALREGKSDVHARELVLDTLLQSAPMAIVLGSANDRIVYANATARRLFGGAFLPGKRLAEALARLPPEIREVVAGGGGGLVATGGDAGEEVYRVIQRDVALGTVHDRLLVLEPITQDLRRQEIETWKKVLRVVCHELNNSLAPVSSLLHSARHVARTEEHRHRQDAILAKVEERVDHLARFLDGYTTFARLPRPRPEDVDLGAFVEALRELYAFRLLGELPLGPGFFDRGQLQQLLINLLKNAHEAGGPGEDVTLRVARTASGELHLSVGDRGAGMTEAVLRSAILPFSSSKPAGMGVGLALCNEVVRAHGGRLILQSRVGEGTTVTCVLPPREQC